MADKPKQPGGDLLSAILHADIAAIPGAIGSVCAECVAAAKALAGIAAKGAAAPKQKVNPVVRPAKITVVVKKFHTDATGTRKAYTKPKRLPVTLTTDAAFNGAGTFTVTPRDKIKFFLNATRTDEMKFDGRDNAFSGAALSRGVTVYAEGFKPSATVDDIKLALALTGGSKTNGPDAKTSATAVEVTLDVCKGRPSAGVEPPPLSADDKINLGRSLLEQDAASTHERAMLIIRRVQPAAFVGNLILKSDNAKLSLFQHEKQSAGETIVPAHTVVAALIPAAGDKLWAEGKTVSGTMRDVGCTLGIVGVDDEGDRVKLTVVRLTLDIGKSRSAKDARGSLPAPMSVDDKVKVGRFLHEQDAGGHHGRALLMVREVLPKKFDGKVALEAILPAKTSLYSHELPAVPPAPADVVTAVPLEIDYKTSKNEVRTFWVQGQAVSGALRDAGYRLRLKDEPLPGTNEVRVTVVKFTDIKATIKSTPPNTRANSVAAGLALPVDHTFDAITADDSFVVNKPLVLMRNAQPDIELLLTAAPAGLPISWDAVRNPLDHASIGRPIDKPTRTPNAANRYKCQLSADAKGSFRIRPYIDSNGTGAYDVLEPSIPLNLILVDAKVITDRSTANTIASPETITPGGFAISTGQFSAIPFTASATEAMLMNLDVEVAGGGADGKLGLDMVFGGLVNMVRVRDVFGQYTDGTVAPPTIHNLRYVAASNPTAATSTIGTRRLFLPTDPAPALFTLPLLDTGRSPGGLGGDTATMSNSQTRPTTAQPAIGQRLTIWCMDSPGWNFPRRHPVNANALLTSVRYRYEFIANFVLWTNVSKVSGATADAANRVYSVVRIIPWQINSAYTTDFGTTPAAPTFAVVTPLTVSVGPGAARTITPVGRAQDNGVEVRPPSGITSAIVADTH